MTTRHDRKSDDLSRGPGMTPIDNPEPDVSDVSHEPDSSTGRLPSQDTDADVTENKKERDTNKRASGAGRK